MTEDDTYRVLKRMPLEQLEKLVDKFDCRMGDFRDWGKLLEFAGWNDTEYWVARKKLVNLND